jgi:hypothetical protein
MLSTKSSGVGGAGKAEERCALGGVKVNCPEGGGIPASPPAASLPSSSALPALLSGVVFAVECGRCGAFRGRMWRSPVPTVPASQDDDRDTMENVRAALGCAW